MRRITRILLCKTIYTRHIHTSMLCRMRFLTVKAAGVKHCPISPGYCPTCKYLRERNILAQNSKLHSEAEAAAEMRWRAWKRT